MIETTKESDQVMAEVSQVETTNTNEEISRMENNIKKEISNLEYYLEPADELIESNDYEEMAIVEKRTSKICENLTDIISSTVERKIELKSDCLQKSNIPWKGSNF